MTHMHHFLSHAKFFKTSKIFIHVIFYVLSCNATSVSLSCAYNQECVTQQMTNGNRTAAELPKMDGNFHSPLFIKLTLWCY